MLSLEHVSVSYDGTPAVVDASLEVPDASVVAVLGPSGCGKSTLLRAVAGLERPTSGTICWDGADLGGVPTHKRGFALMFQDGQLFSHLSVARNVGYALRLRRPGQPRRGSGDIEARIAGLLTLVGLEGYDARLPGTLSGGERQRVALARSLAKAPKLLLLDEPLGALDRKLREETQFELMDIQEKTGTTFVIVTHDQGEAMTVASRVAVMDEGKLMQVSTPDRIYETPQSVYVADFIGDVNIIQGRATQSGDKVLVNWAEGQSPFTAQTATAFAPDQTCWLAIRPEKIAISADRTDHANTVQGKVLDIAYLGNISTYHVELPSGHVIKAQEANTRRIARRAFTWEDPVWLGWTDTAGVLLDR
ncbi:ABC transporter ATP-binding protein [Nocardioides sp.]|uniref:ABC transporter ATP-binding protein n=1 Tax=Nocardioides sp. TaxID=35761 RepID=UPI002B275327|nr:ABC transporter ATP-binding protein [Nocardioides sp.]